MILPSKQAEGADKLSREHWSEAAAEIMLKVFDPVILLTIIAGGEDEFERVARPILQGHMFKREDYRRIFEKLRTAAQGMSRPQ